MIAFLPIVVFQNRSVRTPPAIPTGDALICFGVPAFHHNNRRKEGGFNPRGVQLR
jgi:hypothetical protein